MPAGDEPGRAAENGIGRIKERYDFADRQIAAVHLIECQERRAARSWRCLAAQAGGGRRWRITDLNERVGQRVFENPILFTTGRGEKCFDGARSSNPS